MPMDATELGGDLGRPPADPTKEQILGRCPVLTRLRNRWPTHRERCICFACRRQRSKLERLALIERRRLVHADEARIRAEELAAAGHSRPVKLPRRTLRELIGVRDRRRVRRRARRDDGGHDRQRLLRPKHRQQQRVCGLG